MNKMIPVILMFLLAQILVWFQTYGQYKWEWLSRNTWFLLLSAIPITYLWITGTRLGMIAFDGKSWPLRFLGFCTGIIVFAILSRFILNETMNTKTVVSLILCCVIILIQLF